MERSVGESFKYNGVTLITIENKNRTCKECFFNNTNCVKINEMGLCSSLSRKDNKSVIFKRVEDMETRSIRLTLEKAKEFYKKGGEFKDLALSAFTEEELTKVGLPKTWEEFCSQFTKILEECYIDTRSNIEVIKDYHRDPLYDRNMLPSKKDAEQHLALMQLHQLRDCYRQGWKPDWSECTNKYYICKRYTRNGVSQISIESLNNHQTFLSFQSKSIAEEFIENFSSLIEKAGDLV